MISSIILREQFDEVEVTDKKRPTTAAPTKEELTEVRRENRKFTLKNIGQYLIVWLKS